MLALPCAWFIFILGTRDRRPLVGTAEGCVLTHGIYTDLLSVYVKFKDLHSFSTVRVRTFSPGSRTRI